MSVQRPDHGYRIFTIIGGIALFYLVMQALVRGPG